LETPSRQPLEVSCMDESTGSSGGVLLMNCVLPHIWHQEERLVSQRWWWVGNVECGALDWDGSLECVGTFKNWN